MAKVEHPQGELFPRVSFIATHMNRPSRSKVSCYNKRGTAEPWIKEGKPATHRTGLSCHRFRANEVLLQLRVLAYNLGNLWRRLELPTRVQSGSLTSIPQRRVKTGGRWVKHARYYGSCWRRVTGPAACSRQCSAESGRYRSRRVSVTSPDSVDSRGIRLPLEGKLMRLVESDGRCDEKSGALGEVVPIGV